MATFLFIRHASHGLLGKRFVARAPGVHLSDQGREEANDLAIRLAGIHFEAIYSSPLERARETAQAVSDSVGVSVQVRDELNELNMGDWTDTDFESLRKLPDWKQWCENRSCFCPPGGESVLEVQARMVGLVEKLRHRHSEVVALFSHGDPIKAALAHYLASPVDLLFGRIDIMPASVSVVEVTDTGPQIIRVNDTGPLAI